MGVAMGGVADRGDVEYEDEPRRWDAGRAAWGDEESGEDAWGKDPGGVGECPCDGEDGTGEGEGKYACVELWNVEAAMDSVLRLVDRAVRRARIRSRPACSRVSETTRAVV